MAITRGQLTVLGPESAVELMFQYSADGSSNWHAVFAEGDLYFRVSSDSGVSWSEPARFAGPSGVSTYVHLAYANSADGSVGFSTSISTGKTYLGQLVSSDPTPSQEYGDYKWQKFVGEDGATGRGVSSVVEQFYLSTSKTDQVDGEWSTTMPTWEPGKYVWTRSLITYTSGAPATSTTEPLVSSEWEAANDALEEAKDYTDEIDRKNETKSGNLLTRTFTGPGFEDLTVRGIVRLEAFAKAKGQGAINVYQVDGEKMKVYSVAISSAGFEQVKTGDAVVVTPALGDIDGNVRVEVTGTIEIESLELYGYSIIPEWVTNWSGTATKVGENYVLSPYIFAGQTDINGLATGVSIGMDLTPGDPKPASNIYGYTSGELSYQLTGNTFEMIGLNGTSAGLSTADPTALGVRFWAGAPHEDRNTAPFQVLEDGTLKATKAIIEGSFILTDPNSSNLVVKDTLGSFAYETANLLDDTSGTFETIQLRETVPYRLSSIRVGEDVFLKSGDNLVFTAKLSAPPASVRVGITLVSEIEQEIEEVIDGETVVKTILVEHIEEVYGTISPPESTDPDQSIYTARVDVTIPTGAIYLYPFYVFGDTSNPITWPDNLDGRNLLTVDSGNTRWYGLSELYALDSAITYGEEYTLAAKFEITDIYTEKVRISVPRQSATPFIIGIEEIHASGGLVHFSSTSVSGDPNSSILWETDILVEFLGGNNQTTFGTIEWIQIWKGDIPLANMTSWEPPRITPPGQLIDLEHREQMVSRGEAISVWRPSFNSLSKSVDDKRFVMNYADGLFSQSVQTSEYREKMAEFNSAIEAKADIDDIPDVPALLVQYMKDDYWGIETLKTTINQHGTAVTLVQDSMGYEFINPDLPDLGKNLVFRSAGSTMSLALKSDRISFRSGTEEVAWISGSSLHIASATIVSSLVIGSHMFSQWKDDKKYTVIRAV